VAREMVVPGSRLNLGCGGRPLRGFVNVDLLDGPGVDVVADLGARLPFEDGTADLVYASHVLEHFPTDAVPGILREWRRVLRRGGRILVAVPDLDEIAHRLVSNRGWFTPPNQPWIGAIYGGQRDELDFHKTGFTAPWLASLLSDAGFGSIQRVPRFGEIGANDGSWSPFPFGANVSLNMRAIAGGMPLEPAVLRRSWTEYPFDLVDIVLTTGLRASAFVRSRFMDRRRVRLERTFSTNSLKDE
jgi:SAM-dependent methyltransferase